MTRFLSTVFYSAIGVVLGTGLLFLMLAGIGWMAVKADRPKLKDKMVLHLKLNRPLQEMAGEDPMDELPEPFGSGGGKPYSLLELLPALDRAANDERVEGLFIEAGGMGGGFASMTELRERLLRLRQAGKFVYGYGDDIGEGAFYLMSASDSLFLHPQGALEFDGIGGEYTFYKGMFDKFGIKPEVFRVGSYKSAVEPYLRTSMSEESRYQSRTYLDALYGYYLDRLSESRGVGRDSLAKVSDQMLARSPQRALNLGLVQALGYKDEAEAAVRRAAGLKEDGKIPFLSLSGYAEATAEEGSEDEEGGGSRIAVIVAEGTIMPGNGGKEVIGGNWVAEQLRKARKSKQVKAIVLRINSPGGSALASDIIWREVVRTKGVKPIIASMSDVAASGGYYMAMACDTIVAMPNTITGSIGIFSVYFEAEKMLEQTLGLAFEELTTGTYSNIGSPTDAFTDAERALLQEGIEEGYESFTQKAAEGRGLGIDSLKQLASGRVWIGTDAHRRGLVDVLGTFDDAVALAARSAGLEEDAYRLTFYYRKPEGLLESLGQARQEAARREALGDLYPVYEEMRRLQRLQGTQMLLPEKFSW